MISRVAADIIDSDVDPDNFGDYDAGVITPDDMGWMGTQEGVTVEGVESPEEPTTANTKELPKARTRLKSEAKLSDLSTARTGIPTIDEWMDFFSRVVLRVGTDWLVDWTFRGIDEELLSEREVEKIRLLPEERDRIAKPFAELAYKNRFTRKHGREIIATAGSIDAFLQLALWYSRINRIALKYRRMSGQQKTFQQRTHEPPKTPQRVVLAEEVISDERIGPREAAATATGVNGHFKPDVAGPVWNPDRA